MGMILSISCRNAEEEWSLPNEMLGTWESDHVYLKLRITDGFLHYHYASGVEKVRLTLHEDKTAGGNIGLYHFTDKKIKKNRYYSVVFDNAGKIIRGDVLDSKNVSIRINHVYPHKNAMHVQLRYIDNGEQYTMAEVMLYRVK